MQRSIVVNWIQFCLFSLSGSHGLCQEPMAKRQLELSGLWVFYDSPAMVLQISCKWVRVIITRGMRTNQDERERKREK
ncbi:hypothetical protein CLU79DRAFT_751234 [Phycomyces nitens]|nr:hypothetical protein CLU79DRAFT_751234 [Phycomyces nitens]